LTWNIPEIRLTLSPDKDTIEEEKTQGTVRIDAVRSWKQQQQQQVCVMQDFVVVVVVVLVVTAIYKDGVRMRIERPGSSRRRTT
jgi:hypothetical protein